MNETANPVLSLGQYQQASERAAAQIIHEYSTSFGLATRILGARHRTHIRNIYALVRVADELVDGVAAEAHLTLQQQLDELDQLEAQTEQALEHGYSSNPVVQAFAGSARLSGIDLSLTRPFFASMRMDLHTPHNEDLTETNPAGSVLRFDEDAHAQYVYGSAEVIGMMCLRVFLRNETRSVQDIEKLEQGARSLGAAFQNINFMRDLADDTDRLARSYLSGENTFDETLKARWVQTVRGQLQTAEQSLALLPRDARTGVDCAYRLFSALTDKIEASPAEQLLRQRVRVSNAAKGWLLMQSLAATRNTTPARVKTPRRKNFSQ